MQISFFRTVVGGHPRQKKGSNGLFQFSLSKVVVSGSQLPEKRHGGRKDCNLSEKEKSVSTPHCSKEERGRESDAAVLFGSQRRLLK